MINPSRWPLSSGRSRKNLADCNLAAIPPQGNRDAVEREIDFCQCGKSIGNPNPREKHSLSLSAPLQTENHRRRGGREHRDRREGSIKERSV